MILDETRGMLEAGGESIPYRVVRGKPRRVRMFFTPERVLEVETGNGRLEPFEREFLHARVRWIVRTWRNLHRHAQEKERVLGGVEQQVPILGKPAQVVFVEAPGTAYRYSREGVFTIGAPARYLETHRKKLLYYSLRKLAEQYLGRRLAHWAEVCGLKYKNLRVKDLRSRWGSCSTLGNINLNWQLILLEESLIDYVIVHELMHLREMNHSARFWNWVGKYFPEYRDARQKLKEQQWLVGILS